MKNVKTQVEPRGIEIRPKFPSSRVSRLYKPYYNGAKCVKTRKIVSQTSVGATRSEKTNLSFISNYNYKNNRYEWVSSLWQNLEIGSYHQDVRGRISLLENIDDDLRDIFTSSFNFLLKPNGDVNLARNQQRVERFWSCCRRLERRIVMVMSSPQTLAYQSQVIQVNCKTNFSWES